MLARSLLVLLLSLVQPASDFFCIQVDLRPKLRDLRYGPSSFSTGDCSKCSNHCSIALIVIYLTVLPTRQTYQTYPLCMLEARCSVYQDSFPPYHGIIDEAWSFMFCLQPASGFK
ncbi:hypothetical protein BDP27DRAFT_1335656 [Rhodocollybia butyracea]|uniref:Secreted protein n=1 Tax=Rhodocollybia butyracea TaxID=206335 RepID=A0A9P5PGU8_9AGAR|nr:hypothetical protein BDP27DRAFT_1335656 [Rhodocollybia butyracea]